MNFRWTQQDCSDDDAKPCNDYNATVNQCCGDVLFTCTIWRCSFPPKRDHTLIGFRRPSVLCVVYWWLKRHASSKPVHRRHQRDRMVVGVSSTAVPSLTVVCRLSNSASTHFRVNWKRGTNVQRSEVQQLTRLFVWQSPTGQQTSTETSAVSSLRGKPAWLRQLEVNDGLSVDIAWSTPVIVKLWGRVKRSSEWVSEWVSECAGVENAGVSGMGSQKNDCLQYV